MWGTLVGGIILGVSQAIGAQINPGWQIARRPRRLPGHPGGAAAGPVSARCRDDASRVEHATAVEPHRRRADRARPASSLARGALLGRAARRCGCWPRSSPTWRWRSLWNLLAGYAGLVSVGQQAFVGLGGYVMFALAMLARRASHPRHPDRRAGRRRVVAMPVALLMFRLRGAYFAIGTWVVAEVFRLLASQVSVLGGGSGISLPASDRHRHGAEPHRARARDLLAGAGAHRRGAGRHRGAAALAPRAGADRHPRQRDGRAEQRHRRHAHQVHRLCADRLRHRHDRRADLPDEAAHLARHRLQRERLDRLRHLHHGDRRHRPHRGPDHRHRHLLRHAPDAVRPRQPLPADHGRASPSSSCCSRPRACGA